MLYVPAALLVALAAFDPGAPANAADIPPEQRCQEVLATSARTFR